MTREVRNYKILVTGGAGFIGSNVIEALINQGNEVVCLDNFVTGFRENIEPFEATDKFKLIEGDICDQETCHKACEGVDYVIHQAALGSVPRSIEDPVATAEVNELGFVKMLVAARDAKVKRFVYAASSSTYGDSLDLPKVEERIGKPLSPYGITKFTNELYAENFGRLYGMQTIGLRYFNVFGQRQNPNGGYAAVIPKFCKQLLAYESPILNGDGTYSRDFTYVENVVQINQLAIISNNPNAINQVYNVACGERTSVAALAETLKSELAKYDKAIADVPIVYGPTRIGDIPHSQADISKARSLLGYQPTQSFIAGVKKTAKWYFEQIRT